MKWQDKLTKKEHKHLRDAANVRSIAELRQCRQEQRQLDPTKEVCRHCRQIAVKLGIEGR